MADEVVRSDVEGYEQITEALKTLINQFPGLATGETFKFSTLDDSDDKAIFPTSGAIITSERESITGHMFQICQYPFNVIYRASGLKQRYKINVKEWLDSLGRWLEKQKITINNTEYVLTDYPKLSGTRKIRMISRQSPSYLMAVNEDKSEDWMMSMQIVYWNEYDK